LAADATQAKDRPNVLILIADDWSYPHASIYGDKVVKTPNFDKVARQGMLFHRAYTAAPSCTPSRAGILTGQAIHRLKQGGNLHGVLPAEFTVFPDLLERAGYVLGLVGKGWGPGSLEGTGRTRNPAGPKVKSFAEFLKAVPPDRPFCFWFGSTDPHRPYVKGSGVKSGMNLKDVKVPPCWPDSDEVRSDIADYYWEVQRFDEQVGEILRLLEESGRAENTIVLILSDNGMPFPRGKATLYELGTHMPLAVSWPARVKGGRESNAFVSFTDLAPTILEAAALPIPKDMTGRSLLGILTGKDDGKDRTMVFTERERHANVRRGDLSYPARAVRSERYLYIRNFRPERWPAGDPEKYFAVGPYGDIDDGPTKQLILKLKDDSKEDRKRFELSCGKRPAEELYDCEKDPGELVNLATDPGHAQVKAKLRSELERWMKETGDPRAAPNGGDDRWDEYKYFGAPGKGGKKKNMVLSRPRALEVACVSRSAEIGRARNAKQDLVCSWAKQYPQLPSGASAAILR
jgi:N-sulfoglucosamine sulfohydrolase